MKKFVNRLVVALNLSIIFSPLFALEKTVTGDLQVLHFESQVFPGFRSLRVWLPPQYNETGGSRKFPVLYLNDGQNLFDTETAQFGDHEWRVDEIVNELIVKQEIEPLIVVGIDNAGKRMRSNEYLPWEDIYLHPPLPDPEGWKYPKFLLEEVMPLVERKYRVHSESTSTGLGGSSYGALIALYTVTQHPDRFGKLLIESPSIYVDNGRFLRENRNFQQWPDRIYLGVGTHEGRDSCNEDENQEAVLDVRQLEQLLLANSPDSHLKVVVEKCGLHNEQAYSRRLPNALRFLFGHRPNSDRR